MGEGKNLEGPADESNPSDSSPAKKPSRLKKSLVTTTGICVLGVLAACNTSVNVEAVHSTNPEPDHIPTIIFQSGKIAKRENTPIPKPTRKPNLKTALVTPIPPSESKPSEQPNTPGQSLILKEGYEYKFVTILAHDEQNTLTLDSFHVQKAYSNRDLDRFEVRELAPGLTVEQANRSIDKFIHYDTSLTYDFQLQGKALILRFITTYPDAFPKTNDNQIDLDAAFADGLTISHDNDTYAQGYRNNHIWLGTQVYLNNLTNFTSSESHELVHWLVDPGFATLGLGEGLAEAANDVALGLTPEMTLGLIDQENLAPGCETTHQFKPKDYARAAWALKNADSSNLPGLINFLLTEGIKNKINKGPVLSQKTVETLIEKHYAQYYASPRLGYEARKIFRKLTVLYCSSPYSSP